jgi:sugar lactone lactonase YvrE
MKIEGATVPSVLRFGPWPHKHSRALACVGLVLACCPALPAQSASSYLIATLAGNGTAEFSGDGGPATAGGLSSPLGVAVDGSGNVFIADTFNARIRKVTPQGFITTVAGSGMAGFSGDGGPATAAELFGPYSVAVDALGNLFIADTDNNRIREVTPQGIISTVAGYGSGTYGSHGFSGDGGPATAAELNFPYGVAVDALGNLFIADTENSRIREVTPEGVISTVAGGGYYLGDGGPATAAELNSPMGIAVDALGDLFIGDTFNNRIREVTPQGTISTVAGNGTYGSGGFSGDGGPATAAQLSGPSGVAVDALGNLFIADSTNNRIRQVTPQGIISTVAGGGANGLGDGGPATAAELEMLWQGGTSAYGNASGVAIETSGTSGNLFIFVIDSGNNRIRELIPSSASTAGCAYSLDQSIQSFQAAGGTNTVGVLASETSCPWLALSYANWITVSPIAIASGTELVIDTVSPNAYSASRTATLWIAGQGLTVNQYGVVCSLGVSPWSVSTAASGLTGASLTVTSNAPDCQWTAGASVQWIFVSGGSTGTGSGTVTFTVGVNTGGRRTATMTVAGQTINVAQGAASCNLTGDASTSVADVQLIISEALGAIVPTDDLNGDGVVNVGDVQVVLDAALNLGCAKT